MAKKTKIQATLFDDFFQDVDKDSLSEDCNTKVSNVELIPTLSIDAKNASPIQKTFNRLVKKITSLKEELENVAKREKLIRQFYSDEILVILAESKKMDLEILSLMGEWYDDGKLSKKRKQMLGQYMLEYGSDMMFYYEDDDDIDDFVETFVETYRVQVFGESEFDQDEEDLESIAFVSKHFYGVDIDSFVDDSTSVNDFFDKFKAKLEQDYNNQDVDNENSQPKKRKRTAKQKEKEELELKSIRAIYIEMAKELHPDKFDNTEDKEEKEAQMKELTKAYREKDVFALLTMQLNWMNRSKHDISKQSDEVIKRYNDMMKQQIKALEDELAQLIYFSVPGLPPGYNPARYRDDAHLQLAFKKDKKERKSYLKVSKKLRQVLENKKSLNEFLDDILAD